MRKIMQFAAMGWMGPEDLMLSEVSHKEMEI